jgi:hypothetical protein
MADIVDTKKASHDAFWEYADPKHSKTFEAGEPMDRLMHPLKPIEKDLKPIEKDLKPIEPTTLMDKSTKGSPPFTAAELAQGYRIIKE